jgi:hypothetical protein
MTSAPVPPEKLPTIIKGLLSDAHGTLQLLRDVSFGRAAVYFMAMMGFFALPLLLLIGVFALFLLATSHTLDIQSVLVYLGIFLLIINGSWFLFSFLVHGFLLVMGMPCRIRETLITGFYAITPFALLWWVPCINILAPFWALGLMVYGLHDRQDVPETKAIISVVISVLVLLILEYLMALLWTGISIPFSFI